MDAVSVHRHARCASRRFLLGRLGFGRLSCPRRGRRPPDSSRWGPRLDVGCAAQQLADRIEHQRAGGRGDDARQLIGAFHRQRARWSATNLRRCSPSSNCGSWPPSGASFSKKTPSSVAARRVTSQTPQVRGGCADCNRPVGDPRPDPAAALRDAGEVAMAGPVWEPDAEVVDLDESGVTGIGRASASRLAARVASPWRLHRPSADSR